MMETYSPRSIRRLDGFERFDRRRPRKRATYFAQINDRGSDGGPAAGAHGDRDYCEKQAFATFHESSVRSTPCTGEGEKGVRKPVRDRKSTSALNLRNQPQGRNQTLVVIDEALFVVTSDDPEPISDAEPAVEVIERNIDFDAKRSSTAAGS
ncbi:hypothetical protein GQR58_029729 [Nymphon striatum]|nr:hypothetical protein GQR58_029729 [Nymphon striatum]